MECGIKKRKNPILNTLSPGSLIFLPGFIRENPCPNNINETNNTLFKFNNFAERFGIQTCPAYQGAIDIRHLHEWVDVVRFDAAPV